MKLPKTNGFRLLPSYYEVIRNLPDDQRLQLYDAIMDHGFGNEIEELPPLLLGYFKLISPLIDKSVQFYEKQKSNGAKGGRPSKKTQNKPTENPKETQNKASENLDSDSDSEGECEKKKRARKKQYGVYGWIWLTDAQYESLLSEFGQAELDRCIEYIDECAQSTGNKNKWKDWNLVLRRCHREQWGIRQDKNDDWKQGAVRGWSYE